jgi:hypothetical protein
MNTHPRDYIILLVFFIIILSSCATHRPPTREECLELAGPVDVTITAQLSWLTHYLTTMGNWTNESAARPIYNSLKQKNADDVTNAIVYNVCYPEGGNRLLYLISAVKLGIAGSEQRLNAMLMRYGDKSMAEDYLNSGSSALAFGGRQWAAVHGYHIMTGAGSHRARWGSF